MKIKNLTPVVQQVKIVEIIGGREFTIYIEGNGCTELQGFYLSDTNKLRGIIEVVGTSPFTHSEEFISEDDFSSEEELDLSEDSPEEEEVTPDEDDPSSVDKFICEICGAEFASAR